MSGKAEAESEHDDFELKKKKIGKKKPLENPAVLYSFFMGLSLVIKFHITGVFCLTLLNETTVGA